MKRRDFLKILGLTPSAFAASWGIGNAQERLISHLVSPDPAITPDQAVIHRSVCTECPASCGLRVISKAGNPIKLEGDPADPFSRGGLCIRGQASLGRLYHPERVQQPVMRTSDGALSPTSWTDALNRIREALIAARQDQKTSFYLSNQTTGSLARLMDEFAEELDVALVPEAELLNHGALRKAYEMLFGRLEIPTYRIDRADNLITFGADLFETFINPVRFARDYADAQERGLSWFHLEPHLSLTGCNATERLSIRPGSEAILLAHLLKGVQSSRSLPARIFAAIPDVSRSDASSRSGLPEETIEKLAQALADPSKRPLCIAGGVSTSGGDGLQVAFLTGLLQIATGQVGNTVDFAGSELHTVRLGSLDSLLDRTRAADPRVGVAFISRTHTSSLVPDMDRLIDEADLAVGLTDFIYPSMEACDIILPLSHCLESWGDSEPRRGWRVEYKPVFEPLFDTRSEGDILLDLLGRQEDFGTYLRTGTESGAEHESASGVPLRLRTGAVASNLAAGLPLEEPGEDTLFITPSLRTYDGRSRVITLLHEIPDPLSTVSYGEYLSVSEADADRLSLADGDVVEVRAPLSLSLNVSVRRQVGLPKGVYTLCIDHIKEPLLARSHGTGEYVRRLSGVEIRKTGESAKLPILSGSTDAHGRGIVPGEESEHAGHHDHDHDHKHEPGHEDRFGKTSLYKPHEAGEYRWAMAIDLDKCTGCSACVAACYGENNIPLVGPDEHLLGREMSWIRIQSYEKAHRPLEFIPMMCQHCDTAPCETVCPVLATYHNPEGLNVQVYNRCVGTRYCSNNCPYKARRFNWFPHEWEGPLDRMLNPDVSVRPRGVMEKCTFCVQRIRAAKDLAEDESRPVRDGEIVPACAESCPSKAIVFGNILDKSSQVYALSRSDRAYRVLEELGTGSAVRYLHGENGHEH